MIVRVRVVLKRTVVGDSDSRFDNLSGSHHQSGLLFIQSSLRDLIFHETDPFYIEYMYMYMVGFCDCCNLLPE